MTEQQRQPVKVLTVTSIDTTIVVLLWAQLRTQQVTGYETSVACRLGANREWLEDHGVHYTSLDIRRSISPIADLKTLWKLIRHLRREKITIIHTHTPKAALLGQLAGWFARTPVVVDTAHGFYFHPNMKPLPKMFYIAMAWLGARCATLTLSQNSEDIDTAIRLKICKPNGIRFLGNGIDLTRFDPSQFDDDARVEIRKNAGLPHDKLIIGMVGRLVVEKGYLELFEAVRLLAKKRDDIHLVIIGPEETLRAGAMQPGAWEKYGIGPITTYLGPRDDINALMSCMDIFTLPSWREGFPRSAIEAAAMSLPIVTNDVRGCREVVTDGLNGLLVPPRDATALAAAIERLLDDSAERQRFGQAGRKRALTEFDENIICERVLNVYSELLATKGIPAPKPRPDLDETLPQRGPFVW